MNQIVKESCDKDCRILNLGKILVKTELSTLSGQPILEKHNSDFKTRNIILATSVLTLMPSHIVPSLYLEQHQCCNDTKLASWTTANLTYMFAKFCNQILEHSKQWIPPAPNNYS